MTEDREHRFVYSERPFLIYWELTRACDLACRHCRAEAIKTRDLLELTSSEAGELLEEMRGFGPPLPHLVFTGGDPLKRGDLFELLESAVGAGFSVSVAPSATHALTAEVLQGLKDVGVESIALSLDGATAERHDGLRGVPGCFDRTLEAIYLALEIGLKLQINTLAAADTLPDLPGIYGLLSGLPVMRWKLFALIAVGRGKVLREMTPRQCEGLHHWLYDLSKESHFAIGTTEAPHYRRVVLTRMRAEGIPLARIRETSVGRAFGIRDGNGIMFISHTGDLYPSGFLPLRAGNVRSASVVGIYRESEIFKGIRDTSRFRGKCGLCEFREICGGSRARAYATRGDYRGEDPACNYEPRSAASFDRLFSSP